MKRLVLILALSLMPCMAQASPSVAAEPQASLRAFFAAKPKAQGAVARLVKVRRWPDIRGQVRWSLPALRFLSSRISLIAEQGRGKQLRRWYVPVEVQWMRKVITLKHDVPAQTVLHQHMLRQTWANIADIRGQTWSTLQDVVGLKTLRNMRKGAVVATSWVKRPPLIQRGDHVTIVVHTGTIQVRAEGIALKSGSKGDRMLVQNIRSKQTLQSIVQDAHTVSITMGGA